MALLFSNLQVSIGNTKDLRPAMASQNDDKDLQIASLLVDFLVQFISRPKSLIFRVCSSESVSHGVFFHAFQVPLQRPPRSSKSDAIWPISGVSSVSSDCDSEPEVESMTGKVWTLSLFVFQSVLLVNQSLNVKLQLWSQGFKHLCSELLELRAESSEEPQKYIFANYSAPVR